MDYFHSLGYDRLQGNEGLNPNAGQTRQEEEVATNKTKSCFYKQKVKLRSLQEQAGAPNKTKNRGKTYHPTSNIMVFQGQETNIGDGSKKNTKCTTERRQTRGRLKQCVSQR